MRKFIGLTRQPKGGFGNRVLTYISLRELCFYFETEYFSRNLLDRRRISGIHKTPPLASRFSGSRNFSRGAILQPEFEKELKSALRFNLTVQIQPPLLGEVYARFATVEPRTFVKSRIERCPWHSVEARAEEYIAVHLGSRSSYAWDPSALPPVDYFLHSLEESGRVRPDISVVRICTDDLSNPAISAIKATWRGEVFFPGNEKCEDSFSCDFASMVESAVLVSGPSTFSIVAGMVGDSQIIQYRKWAEKKAELGELFWEKMLDNSLIGYRASWIL